jgi:hypothetical protein
LGKYIIFFTTSQDWSYAKFLFNKKKALGLVLFDRVIFKFWGAYLHSLFFSFSIFFNFPLLDLFEPEMDDMVLGAGVFFSPIL